MPVQDPLSKRSEAAKYMFPDIAQGALKLTKSDILLLLAIHSFGPMSPYKFNEACERMYDFSSFIFPLGVQNKNEQDRIHWTLEPVSSLDDLAFRFERLLEEDHAPTIRFPNTCPICKKGILKKGFETSTGDQKEATWTCQSCFQVFGVQAGFIPIGVKDEVGPHGNQT